MNIKRFVLSVLAVFVLNTVSSQTNDLFYQLNEQTEGCGTITLTQESKLSQMIDAYAIINKRDGVDGYRIQIFSSSGQNARSAMAATSQQFMKNFPDFDPKQIYTEYKAPYFKLCVGDFRSRGSANTFYHKIRQLYPDSYIVKSKIRFPKLTPDDIIE